RETEVIALVAEGLTDQAIADQLYISVRTVRSHLDRIRDKTGARRRAELTRLASQLSLEDQHAREEDHPHNPAACRGPFRFVDACSNWPACAFVANAAPMDRSVASSASLVGRTWPSL